MRREIDGEDGTFLIILRTKLRWDWEAFDRLTKIMFEVATEAKGYDQIDKYIAQGFWFFDTWVKDWTGHADFPRPKKREYDDAIQLLHDLCYFYFIGQSPLMDNGLGEQVRAGVR